MIRVTVLVPARNAEQTIERAIRSALTQGCPILLIDDFSSDRTVERAERLAGARLSVVVPREYRTLGGVRQVGIEAIESEFGVWLDADDELLPGRVERLVGAMMRESSDFAGDGLEWVDGETGASRGHLPIPEFLFGRHPLARQFERNYLPGPGVLGFRAQAARRLGYDVSLHGAEDVDLILRAVASDSRFSLIPEVGYRAHAYPDSLSRRLQSQRDSYRMCLRKHDYAAVRELFIQAGYSARIAAWGLLSMAVFREEYAAAMSFLSEAAAPAADPGEILEPEGPDPYPEGWRIDFWRGTLLALQGESTEALACLESAEKRRPSAEGANNLGVVLARLNRGEEAQRWFQVSLERFPAFADAAANRRSPRPDRITTHPLRSRASRNEYPRGWNS